MHSNGMFVRAWHTTPLRSAFGRISALGAEKKII